MLLSMNLTILLVVAIIAVAAVAEVTMADEKILATAILEETTRLVTFLVLFHQIHLTTKSEKYEEKQATIAKKNLNISKYQ